MRNHVALLLCALSLSLMLTGCNSSQVNSLSTNASVSSTPAEQPVTPTSEPSNWELVSGIDDFGEVTAAKHLVGTFSGRDQGNISVSPDPDMTVRVYCELGTNWNRYFGFVLESSGYPLITLSEGEYAVLAAKIDGETYRTQIKDNGDGLLVFIPEYLFNDLHRGLDVLLDEDRVDFYGKLVDSLMKGNTVPCYIEIGAWDDVKYRLGDKYSFQLDGKGFAEHAEEIISKECWYPYVFGSTETQWTPEE